MRKTLLFYLFVFFLIMLFPLAAGASNDFMSRDEALEKAKEIFPEVAAAKESDMEFELFQDEFGQSQWSVYWSDSGSPTYADIIINAQDSTLTYCDLYKEEKKLVVPEKFLTRQEAQAIAHSFACRHQPKRMESTAPDYRYADQSFELNREFSFRWKHEAAGIPVDGNNIRVDVDAATGQVTRFECFWRDISQLPPNNAMNIQEFTGQAVDRLGIIPFYFALPSSTGGLEAKLSFTVDSTNHHFAAETGTPLDEDGKEVSWEEARLFEGLTPQNKPGQQVALSGRERGITFAEGKRIAGAFFEKMGLQGTLEPLGITRNAQPGYSEEYWNYMLIQSPENEEPFSLISLSIKAANGRIAGYYQGYYYESSEDMSTNEEISCDQALHAAKSFLTTVGINEKDYFLTPQLAMHYEGADDVYRFLWCRKINGVPSDDYLGIEVSRLHGLVTYFHEDTCPISSFPSIKNLLPRDEAEAKMKELKPFELAYVWPSAPAETDGPILVYRTDTELNSIDAHSGEVLDMETCVWSSMLEAYNNKLRSHWGKAPLTLLAETGRLPFPWLLEPDGTVKKREGLRIMELITAKAYPQIDDLSPFKDVPESDRDILPIIHGVKNDILDPGGVLNPDAPLTREDLAVWIINAMGYKEVADSPVSMNVKSKDASSISRDKRNHAALAQAFKLMSSDNNGNFRPKDPVTWAELATTIMRAFPRLDINTGTDL